MLGTRGLLIAVVGSATLLVVGAASVSCASDAVSPSGAWRSVYVAPNGNDANPGTLEAPVVTPHRAVALVRAFGPKWEGDVAILFRGGMYSLDRTLILEPADSGKNGHKLLLQPYGEEVVTLSGGTPVTDWSGPDDRGIYSSIMVPKGVEFRHLVVNGQRAQRARHPNGNDFHAIAAWDKPAPLPTLEGPKEPFGRRLGVRDKEAQFVDSLDPAHLSQVEVFVERYCGSAILRVASVGKPNEGGKGVRYIIPKSPERDRLFGTAGGSVWQSDRLAFRFENALPLLDEPGEWFLDRAGTPTLYYKPRKGERLEKSIVLAPRLETLIRFKGAAGDRVHDIVLRGLRFTATTWFLPNKEGFVSTYPGVDYRDNSGGWDVHLHPAAIHLEGTEGVTLDRNVLHAVGGMGIALYDDTRQTTVDGNALLETGGIPIVVDGEGFVGKPEDRGGQDGWVIPFPPADKPHSERDRITNNRIQHFGLDLWSSGGIVAAYPWEMTVEHNEISDGYGPGVELGWYGNFTRCHKLGSAAPLKQCQSSSGRNRIIGNRVFAVGSLNTDVGGIYTISHQSPTDTFEDGLTIRGNHVFGMKRLTDTFPTVLASLYIDGDSSFTTVVDNIFEKPYASAKVEGPFGYLYGDISPIFLNVGDETTSVPPHDIRWGDRESSSDAIVNPNLTPEERQKWRKVLGPGDNVAHPSQKPHVRDTAGLLPAYRNVPKVAEER